jgi:hypothetical protein
MASELKKDSKQATQIGPSITLAVQLEAREDNRIQDQIRSDQIRSDQIRSDQNAVTR